MKNLLSSEVARGVAAIYYGIQCKADIVISGAPQYHLGTYLSKDGLKPILESIVGGVDSACVEKLNGVVRDLILSTKDASVKIYLHYSPYEHTYPEHIKDLIHDLKISGYTVEEDNCYEYTEHSSVGRYFIPYMKKILNEFQGQV